MIAKNNDLFQEAEETMKDLSQNWAVRLQCEMREYDRKLHQLEIRDAFEEGVRQEHERMMQRQKAFEEQHKELEWEHRQLKEEHKNALTQKDLEIQQLREQLQQLASK